MALDDLEPSAELGLDPAERRAEARELGGVGLVVADVGDADVAVVAPGSVGVPGANAQVVTEGNAAIFRDDKRVGDGGEFRSTGGGIALELAGRDLLDRQAGGCGGVVEGGADDAVDGALSVVAVCW